MEMKKPGMYQRYFKRMIDFGMAFIGLLFTWPLFIGIAALIKLESPGPVFFRQKRVGKGKQLFEIYKFRTMRTDTPKDTPTHLLNSPEIYITRVGRILRKTSLDEIPQIFNILKGEMSVIGPRPALWNQDDLIAERDKYGANDILPGLTGWAQINGRDELAIWDKAKFDGEYAERVGIEFELMILWVTLFKVIVGKGVIEGAKVSNCDQLNQKLKPENNNFNP